MTSYWNLFLKYRLQDTTTLTMNQCGHRHITLQGFKPPRAFKSSVHSHSASAMPVKIERTCKQQSADLKLQSLWNQAADLKSLYNSLIGHLQLQTLPCSLESQTIQEHSCDVAWGGIFCLLSSHIWLRSKRYIHHLLLVICKQNPFMQELDLFPEKCCSGSDSRGCEPVLQAEQRFAA